MAGVAGAEGHGHPARLPVPVCHRKPALGNLTVPSGLLQVLGICRMQRNGEASTARRQSLGAFRLKVPRFEHEAYANGTSAAIFSDEPSQVAQKPPYEPRLTNDTLEDTVDLKRAGHLIPKS